MTAINVLTMLLDQFKSDLASFKDLKDSCPSESELKARIQDLDSDFKQAKELHNDILRKKPTDQINAYLSSQTFENIRSNYYNYWAELDTLLQNFAARGEDHNQSLNTSHSFRNYTDAKPYELPVIQLPKFSGDYKKWRKFYKLFNSLVHQNRNLDKIQKFTYLHTHLEDEALDVISNLELEEANYDSAIELLIERYDHKRMLVYLQISTILNYPRIFKETTSSLRSFLNVIKECVLQLRRLKEPVDSWNSILVFLLIEKIPNSTRHSWNEHLKSRTDVPTYSEFYEFLNTRFRTSEMDDLMDDSKSNKCNRSNFKNFHLQSDQIEESSNNSKLKCLMCQEPHFLDHCSKFEKLEYNSKLDFIKKQKICSNCLTNSHTIFNCRSKRNCKKCHKRHHYLMHNNSQHFKPKTNSFIKNNSNNSQRNSQSYHSNQNPKQITSLTSENIQATSQNFYVSGKNNIKLLGTALVKVLNNNGEFKLVRALVDPCSDDNYVTDSLVKSLKIKKQLSPTVVSVLGDASGGECPYRSMFKIQSNNNEFKIDIAAAVIETISSNIPSGYIDASTWSYLSGLKLADPIYFEPGKVELLLGISVYSQIVQQGLIRGDVGKPFATQTALGWLIRGDTSENISSIQSKTFATFSNNAIESQISKFWELEQFEESSVDKPEVELCENLFKKSVTQGADHRFCVKLPFKDGVDPKLGNSKQIALKRFMNIEHKLTHNENLKNEYIKSMKEYIDEGYMIEAPISFENNPMQYFLPHHAVIKSSSSTTKVRVVFDASCKTSDGTSLNDHMLTGPKLQKDITDILFNWRKYRFAFSADIARMYLQFKIDPSHYPYQSILWRFSPSEPIKEYYLTTVTFGTSAAPFLAMRLLLHLASQEFAVNEFPLAVHALKTEFYVDDLLSGDHSVQGAIKKYEQILSLLAKAKLSIRKWCSNSNSILEHIPEDIKEVPEILNIEENDFKKTLGMFWSPREDIFSFSINVEEFEPKKLTKRKILSMIARLYDPLGFISPSIMYAKQIMKKIWLTQSDWDSEVSSDIHFDFSLFINNLEHLKNIKIPRWNKITDDTSKITLIGFCDASVKGFGAVVYLKNPVLNERSELVLLTSKTRVAPTKFVSVARLELCGALLLAELLNWCSTLYTQPVEFHAFCDSQIVLSWLNSHASRWKTFVAHRISKIQKFSNINWHYVNTKSNPADLASRGVLPSALPECDLWWKGPKFSDLDFSPFYNKCTEDELKITEIERNKKICFCTNSDSLKLINYYSSFQKLCSILKRITYFIIMIYEKLIIKKPDKKQHYQSLIERLNNPENIAFRLIQKTEYHCEIKLLKKGEPLLKTSRLISLTPFIDGFGILRVGGRLENSSLTYNEKHPIILPPYNQQTTNIIREAHKETLHGGNKLLWSFLRRKFFIVRGQDRIRKILNDCFQCIRYKKVCQEQLMGNLPAPRVNETRCFLNCGVDYAGPINLKAWKGKCNKISKSYICVFVCLSTKALHLELVSDLSSETFLAAFKRLIYRRGHIENLYSDNGTNFVGANKILLDEIRKAEIKWKCELENSFSKLATKWHFIPPSSPHFGGLWEAGVKSVKTHLTKIVGNTSLTYEELITLLVQVEGILNSRPLCSISNDPESYSALTPAHFLIGEPIIAPIEPQIPINNHPLRRWQLIQKLQQQFSKEYKKDYLHKLNNRPKWQIKNRDFQINDLVLLAETNVSPTDWPKARIIEIFPGKDNITRVVSLKTQDNKIFKRPVTKIRLLPTQNELMEKD